MIKNSLLLDTQVSEFINTLIQNQNNTTNEEHKDLLNEKDYLIMLSKVLNILKENNFSSIEEAREELFRRSKLVNHINYLTRVLNITPGMVIDFGTKNNREIILTGNQEEVVLEKYEKKRNESRVQYETIYDLASTSKFFTSLLIYYLSDQGYINLHDPIMKYAPMFKNLPGVTIYDLLKFKTNISTPGRIDSAKDFDEAERILFSASFNLNPDPDYAYTDIGAMVLKYVVEAYTNEKFSDLVRDIIFKKANMKNSFLNIPEDKLDLVASNNFNSVVNKKGIILENGMDIKGTNHDPKAKMIKQKYNEAPGHAGYFSNTPDMINLGETLLEGRLLKRESILDISTNHVGKKLEDGSYAWYFGSLVFLKQLNGKRIPTNLPLSGRAFASPGFGGTFFCLDPLNEISLFIGSNRLHNRIYQIPYEFEKDNKYLYRNHAISKSFAYEIPIIVDEALKLSIQYKFLEQIYTQDKKQVRTRTI